MLILASQSPRRAEILKQGGFDFVVRPAAVDETPLVGESPQAHVKRLARAKALTAIRLRMLDINVLMLVAAAGAVALGQWAEAGSVVLLRCSLMGCVHRNTSSCGALPVTTSFPS